ncbi:hypothetical protein [Variovorax paradoxus]|uniref:Uncharacterized protein n=1 Tax=Variovorax paradoxus TaxID=34073 RepID=A0A679JC53_VARPD|nr:hypothetical protein VVAX_04324 [Variovorax paradoxus]
MRIIAGPALAAMSAAQLAIAQLVYMGFPGLPIALNNWNLPLVYGGVTYMGAAGLGSISPIEDSPGEIKGLQFEMSGVPIENLALALADSTIVQGTPISIRLAIVSGAQVLDAPLDWTGLIDTMSIQEDGNTCSIAVTAESTAVDLLRGTSLTTSDADQRFLYPGDRAFEYIVSQANVPIVWPTKQYYIDSR